MQACNLVCMLDGVCMRLWKCVPLCVCIYECKCASARMCMCMCDMRTHTCVDWFYIFQFSYAVQADIKKPLAVWLFIRPDSITMCNDVLKLHGFDNGFESRDVSRLDEDSIWRVHDQINAHDTVGIARAIVVQQYHGMRLHVMPGWGHYVLNLQPCVKLAWDVVHADRLHLYAANWKRNMCKLRENIPDYINFGGVIRNYIDRALSQH